MCQTMSRYDAEKFLTNLGLSESEAAAAVAVEVGARTQTVTKTGIIPWALYEMALSVRLGTRETVSVEVIRALLHAEAGRA